MARLKDWVRAQARLIGPPPRLSRRNLIFDGTLALALAVLAIVAGGEDVVQDRHQIEFDPYDVRAPEGPVRPEPVWPPFLPIEPEQRGWPVVMLLVVLPLVLRRRYPLAMLWVVLVTAPLTTEFQAAQRLSFFACVIAAYSAAVFSPHRLPALASLPLAAILYSGLQSDSVPTVPNDVVPFLILLPIVVVAAGLRRWRHRADEDRARLAALERDQLEELRRATEHERARIARELHDVVTHNVSVMVIQAGAARKVMAAAPDQAEAALLAVEASGRAAMTELRQVMGLLTVDGEDSGADLAPQPGMDRLDSLVRRVRDAGVPVDLTVTGTPVPLPAGVELTVYRVVQEALTNTVRHAGGSAARVTVEYAGDRLLVDVVDAGGGTGPPGGLGTATGAGTGRGLLGLRERLVLYGGTLDAGPRPTGGYRVHAVIPLTAP
jgi:signal transduction histidine kinase